MRPPAWRGPRISSTLYYTENVELLTLLFLKSCVWPWLQHNITPAVELPTLCGIKGLRLICEYGLMQQQGTFKILGRTFYWPFGNIIYWLETVIQERLHHRKSRLHKNNSWLQRSTVSFNWHLLYSSQCTSDVDSLTITTNTVFKVELNEREELI